ncbi:acetyl-CoA carboxylase biotin carboxyl carrier protein [Paraburkholderia tropica]|uniref:Biotin carboxyl carrier protein n=1 Tax=Paraburkholderia tropica TaxID=92647 RepID=A0AAQ1GIJ9_9BURK|nr:biotin/lipoyl-containing protein [Paraburkholderia tropica]RQN38013.1 hypothetical protein EHZ25_16080 [Paraburkholderia tropica]SEJ99195.1 Biotin carboxyl carrier protein [Paraburkholderia tropica]
MTLQNQADIRELRQITTWLADAGVEFIEIGRAGMRVRLTLEPDARAAAVGAPVLSAASRDVALPTDSSATRASADRIEVRAPLAGQFLAAHPARVEPLASAGMPVAAGDVLGLVRVADLCVPVVAAGPGIVEALLAEPGAAVGYGEPLFALSPVQEAGSEPAASAYERRA